MPGDRHPTFASRYIKSRVRGRNRWSQSIHRKVQRPVPLYHSTMHRPSQGIASAFTAWCDGPPSAVPLAGIPPAALTAIDSPQEQTPSASLQKLLLKQLEQRPTQKQKEERQTELLLSSFVLVPGTGIEPVRPQWPRDFKSLVSTNSTIWATFSGYKGTPFARMPKGNGARKHNTCLKFPARNKSSDIFHVSKHKNASS